jgi:small subunit ribosomal protein S7e
MSAKIVKPKGQKPTDLENQVAQALSDLQSSVKDLTADLTDLYITAAKEVVTTGPNRTAIVIFVPYKLHKKFQKIQERLIRDLQKKFSGKHVCFVAQRTILSKSYIRGSNGELRPRSRTLTAVHDAILEDIVYPVQIVAKRTRVRLDQSKLLKVFLDPKDVKECDFKLKTFAAVYKKLTNKAVEFSFPVADE